MSTLLPIHRSTTKKDEVFKANLQSEYLKMISSLQENPKSIAQFTDLLETLQLSHVSSKGNLIVKGTSAYYSLKEIPCTDFAAIPVSVARIHYIDHTEHFFELLILSSDAPSKTVSVELSMLSSTKWLDELGPEYVYNSGITTELRLIIQNMAKYAPVHNEFRFSGWDPNHADFYIMCQQKLCKDIWDTESTSISCHHALEMLNVASLSLTIPLLSISLLSLVHSKMVATGTYFKGVGCIVAPTQSFKTTLASLFFDYQNGQEADTNFEATQASIIRAIGNARDKTVIIDDYKPGSTRSESNAMMKKLSTVIRMCSDNSGGVQKAGGENSIIANQANCMVMVTAEQIHLTVQSTLARLLVLEGNRNTVNIDKLTYFQENHHLYRNFIQDFISYIAVQGVASFCENLRQNFLQNRNILRQELLKKDIPVDNRTNDMCVWLHLSFRAFLNYAIQTETIVQEEAASYSAEAFDIFLTIMERQADRVAELDDTRRFFHALRVLLDAREVHLPKLKPRNNSFAADESKTAIGFQKRDFVYLKNDSAYQQVVAYYRRLGKEFVLSESALRKIFADNKLIDPKTEKTYIHRLYVNQESYQCIRFQNSKFFELLRGGQRNGTDEPSELPSDWEMQQLTNDFLGRGT